MHSKTAFSRSWGFAHFSFTMFSKNKFKHCLIRKFSGPSEIFRCYLIVYCLIINVLLLSRDSLFRLSHRSCLVNNFFYFFNSFFEPLLPCSATRLILSFYFPLVNIFFDIFLTIFNGIFTLHTRTGL